MAVNLSMLAGAGAQFFDNNGDPLSGGKVYTYAAGTTTPQATYTTSAGNVAHANPIVLDSAGRVPSGGEIWLTDVVSYKFLLTNSTGTTIGTYDNVTGNGSGVLPLLVASSGSSIVGFIQAGTGATATTVQEVLRRTVSVKDFGAIGDNNQTLYGTNYQTDATSSPVTINQQTADALAINKAIVYLRSIGGGKLVIPKGIYRIWGYLERIDFPCQIVGDGIDQTILKNCDTSPTNTNGYGIFCVQPASVSAVTFQDLTLDGNAVTRTKPTNEYRLYPIVFYGFVNGIVNNLKSINSPIDCFLTSYSNTNDCSMQVSNCTFDNSFRNTMSLVAGWNQSYVNCDITGGGKVQGGTSPRYCLDIEPNSASNPIKNIKFSNCRFSNAESVLIGGAWCEAHFSNCDLNCIGSTVANYPWAFSFGQAQVTIANSKINGDPNYLESRGVSYPVYVTGAYKEDQYLKITGCEFYGCGINLIGRRTIIENTLVMNSKYPVLANSSLTYKHTVHVNGLILLNVIDGNNYGAGAYSSFVISNTVEGPVIINDLRAMIDDTSLPVSPSFVVSKAYGIFLSSSSLTGEMKLSNIHCSGFYQKYPTATGQTLSASNFRDWASPNLPPANTAGQTAAPASIYYANCTMYGNSP
jgi:hypothetical protein